MSGQDNTFELESTRQQLKDAHLRVAELEALLADREAKTDSVPTSGDNSRYPAVSTILQNTNMGLQVADSLLEGCQLIGFDWRYLYINDAAARHGYQPKKALLGYTMMEKYPGIENTEMFAALRRCMEDRVPCMMENEFVYPDGLHAWFSLSIQPAQEGILVFSLDISDRNQAEEALRIYAQRMEILHDIDTGIIASDSLQGVINTALKNIRRIIPCQRASILLFSDAHDEATVFAANQTQNGGMNADEGSRFAIHPDSLKRNISEPSIVVDDLRLEVKHNPNYQMGIDAGLLSAFHVSLFVQGRLVGLLSLAANTVGFFDEAYQEIALQVGSQLAIAMQQLRLSEELERYTTQLEQRVVERTGELQASKDRMEAILNNSVDGILLVSADLTIQQTNEAFRRLFACEAADYFNEPLTALLVPDERDPLTKLIAGVTDRKAINVELRACSKDGWEFDAEFDIGFIEKGGFVCSIRDITARKRNEASVRESELRYRMVAENITDVVARSNLIGECLYISPSSVSVMGYTPGEMMGQTLFGYVHPEDLPTVWDAYAAALQQPIPRIFTTYRFHHKDGHYIWVESVGRPVHSESGDIQGFVTSSRDVTERQRIAAELQRQRSFLQNVIDVSPSMIFVKDYDAKFVLVNPMVARMYNATVEELIGKTDADFNPSAQEAEDFLIADRKVIASGLPLFIEEPITNPSGETRWLQTTKVRIIGSDGQSIYVLGISTDITERRKAEDTLRVAFESERELGELKSRFVSMASHEFRTPLATILALTETLIAYRHRLSDEQIDERLFKTKDQVSHLKSIMDDVLLLSRMQARRAEFNPVLVDLDALCRSVLDEFENQPDIPHLIEYTCDPALREVKLDKKLMRQIINNLVSNAVKYSTEGQPIYISLGYLGDALVLKVTDSGIGIPEADLKHMFEPFHRAENVGTIPGTGLGLVITKESVELHGGSIRVESEVGIGTTFIVSIPVAAEGI